MDVESVKKIIWFGTEGIGNKVQSQLFQHWYFREIVPIKLEHYTDYNNYKQQLLYCYRIDILPSLSSAIIMINRSDQSD